MTDVLAGSNPSALGPKKKGPHSWEPIKSVVGDEGCRVRLTPPALASGLRPSRAALENASRFLSSAPLRVRIPLRWAQKRKAPIAGSLSNQWWAMRDVRVRLAPPAPCFVAPLLACCAGKRFAFPQLRTLSGSNPMHWAQKRKAPIAGSLSNQWWAMRDSNPQPCACKAPALTVAPIARAERV